MEYLDPEKKRKHRRLIGVGYVLLGVVIAAITGIVLLAGYGYEFDRDTGEFVQNGIMFVDVRHRPAQIQLNNENIGQTDLRLVLREGMYEVQAIRDGYRTWRRNVDVEGGELRKLTYGLLVPEVLQSEQRLALEYQPTRALQSIDKQRVVTWNKEQNSTVTIIELTDLPVTTTSISLQNLLDSVSTEEDVIIEDLEFVDFDSSDTKVLTYATIDGKIHTWVIDTQNAEGNTNVSDALPSAIRQANVEISMIDRNAERFFIFDRTAGEVYQAELQSGRMSLATLPDINQKFLDFIGFGDDWFLYVIESDGEEGLVDVMFRQNSETIMLKKMKTADKYFLALAQNGNDPFIGIGASSESDVFVYKDPVGYLNNNETSILPAPSTIARVDDLLDITISNDASTLLAHSGTQVVTFDIQAEETWRQELDHILKSEDQLQWIDGQHYTYVNDGIAWLLDFDGSNRYQLTGVSSLGIFYLDDAEGYFAFTDNDVDEDVSTPASLVFTSLLTEADR